MSFFADDAKPMRKVSAENCAEVGRLCCHQPSNLYQSLQQTSGLLFFVGRVGGGEQWQCPPAGGLS